ncbi:MAG: polysaccharide pyruvyl transferase family protein [Chlamydiae bacterium]|nr:polysaccharide pyruvyl transferase family protein [Chlamydiota bacterium]
MLRLYCRIFFNESRKLLLSFAFLMCSFPISLSAEDIQSLPLYYWDAKKFVNFGDYLSVKIVEKMIQGPVEIYKKNPEIIRQKLLALGSILYFAEEGDVLWGTGARSGKMEVYKFSGLDVRSVRGPLTRQFLIENFGITVPEIYGDPALLLPYLFPEFQKKHNPTYEYLIIAHFSDVKMFPKSEYRNVVYATDPWDEVIEKILDSKFVISSSLHGIIVAEAYGIPARWLRVSKGEPLFKFHDYYLGTNRAPSTYATSIEEALSLGGEDPFECDLQKLYDAFPFDYFPK